MNIVITHHYFDLGGNEHMDYDPNTKNIYIASFASQRIYSLNTIDISATPQIIASTGVSGNNDGAGLSATFRFPNGITVTKTGNSIYVNTAIDPAIGNLNPQIIRLLTGVLSGTASVESISLGYKNLKTYPNPTTNKLNIDVEFIKSYKNLSIQIFNILGKEVVRFDQLKTNGLHFKKTNDLSKLATGTYIYQLSHQNKKIIKRKTC